MVAKRIIPCLDVKEGCVVKGIHFEGLHVMGDPVELGSYYAREGADELVYLDISASSEGRKTFAELVERVARRLDIPFTVGGGVASLADAARLLDAGADKVALNSAALSNPALIGQIAARYGSQFVTVAVDARCINRRWEVYSHGGTRSTGRELFAWCDCVQQAGAGEILFTSIDHDGVGNGFAYSVLDALSRRLSVPIIASGGAGKVGDFVTLFRETQVDAALAATVFHSGKIRIQTLKQTLRTNNIDVR